MRSLTTTQQKNIDKKVLKDAIIRKFDYRESNDKLNNTEEIMKAIKDSEVLKMHWQNYQSKYAYVEDISYENIVNVRVIQCKQ